MKNTKLSANEILKKAKEKDTRIKVSFTLDGDVFEKFKAKCEKNEAAMSRVLEELMRQFND